MKNVVVGIHLERDDISAGQAFPIADVWLSALELHDDQPLGDRDLLLRVAKMRAELLEHATFIAVRYGCVVPPLPPVQPHWRATLEKNRDNVEMTLKVAASAPKPRPRREDFTSGAAYLRALHESSAEVDEAFKRAAEKAIDAIEVRWLPRDNASLEMAALVRRDSVDAARAAATKLKAEFPRVPFLLSGPWPLEAFAE